MSAAAVFSYPFMTSLCLRKSANIGNNLLPILQKHLLNRIMPSILHKRRHLSCSVRDSEAAMQKRVERAKNRFVEAQSKYEFTSEVDHIMRYYPRALDLMHFDGIKKYFMSRWFGTKQLQQIDPPFTRVGFVQGMFAVDTSLIKILRNGNVLLLDTMLTPSAYQEVCDNYDNISETTRSIIETFSQKLDKKKYAIPDSPLQGFDYILEINIQKKSSNVTNVRVETMRATAFMNEEAKLVDHFCLSHLILEREYSPDSASLWRVHKFAYLSVKDNKPGANPLEFENRYHLHWF